MRRNGKNAGKRRWSSSIELPIDGFERDMGTAAERSPQASTDILCIVGLQEYQSSAETIHIHILILIYGSCSRPIQLHHEMQSSNTPPQMSSKSAFMLFSLSSSSNPSNTINCWSFASATNPFQQIRFTIGYLLSLTLIWNNVPVLYLAILQN